MPELPEVETIRKALEKKILNKKIIDVFIHKTGVVKEPSVDSFKKGLLGEAVKEVFRKGKALIFKISECKFVVVHLRISGWLLYGEENKGARVSFKFADGTFLNYMDHRLLGELRLRRSYLDLKFIKSLGPEPFEMSLAEFTRILKSKKTRIKVLLMDQSVISGIGNIYAQEALFSARIDPQRPANSLSSGEIKILHKKMIEVLNEAVKYRGSSVDSYRDIEGKKGGMEERLRVYGRESQPCFSCKKNIKKISLGGRGTCYCPHCQK